MLLGSGLGGAISRYDSKVAHHSRLRGVGQEAVGRQGDLMCRVDIIRKQNLLDAASEWQGARLKSAAAEWAGIWLDAPPDRNSGLRLSNAEVRSRVSRRLGREICSEVPCPLCLGVMDRWGVHVEWCVSRGDKTGAHHRVRNSYHKQAKRANFAPPLGVRQGE